MSVKGGEITCFALTFPEPGGFLLSFEIKGKGNNTFLFKYVRSHKEME